MRARGQPASSRLNLRASQQPAEFTRGQPASSRLNLRAIQQSAGFMHARARPASQQPTE
eukprot:COSAG05_NODE_10974_length_536_cov_1.805492_1_plen_58_part_01